MNPSGVASLPKRLRALVPLLYLGAMYLVAAASVAADSLTPVVIDAAEATLMPDGLPPENRQVALRHRWEKDYPGRDGMARYRLVLPPLKDAEPRALLLDRSGNQIEIRINGQIASRIGKIGDSGFDALKASHLVELPAVLLRSDAPNNLEILLSAQALRAAGLGKVVYGPVPILGQIHDTNRFWEHQLPQIYAISLALMGALTLALWWRHRDALYGCFSAAAFSGCVRVFDQTLLQAPLPWPHWGMVVAACYTIHLCFVARFVLLALELQSKRLVRAIYIALITVQTLVVLSFALKLPYLWTVGLGILLGVGLGCFSLVLRNLLATRRPIALTLTLAGSAAIACGIHDLILVRIGLSPSSGYPLMPHSIFFFVLILAGIVVDRYSRSITAVQELNSTLAERVADRERQLTEAFTRLRIQQEEQALATERQRIMRELHDGIGSQLIGILNLLDRQQIDPSVLSEHLNVALDEMRIAVDSLQPLENDLTIVLANLRYRLQPRLAAAGLSVEWNLPQLPVLPQLTPQSILNLQRILLEAFTNTLKHARATRISISANCGGTPPAVQIVLEDNGIGWPNGHPTEAATRCGHGIANMHARATAIGAALRIGNRPDGGLRICLDWPIPSTEP